MQKRVFVGLSIILVCAAVLFTSAVIAEESHQNDLTAGMNIPETVAQVNGVKMNSKFVKFEFNRIMKYLKGSPDDKQKHDLVREIIDKEVIRELVFQKGKEHKKQVPAQTVNEEYEKLKSGYRTADEFYQALNHRGISEAEIKKSIETDIMARQLLEEQVAGKIKIRDEEVQKFYDTHKERFLRPEAFRAKHIFISIYPMELIKTATTAELDAKKDEYQAKAESRIQGIYTELQNGVTFEKLAEKHSDDQVSAKKGGDLDFIYKGVFHPNFDEAVAKLTPGQTSGVVRTPLGFHIIKLIETKPSEYAPFEEMKGAIQSHMFTEVAKGLIGEYISELKQNAKIEIYF